MAAKGAKYKWKNGNILHAARFYKSPTMRRIPRILIEDRALEVGLILYIDDIWMVYKESEFPVESIALEDGVQLEFYMNRFQLLPVIFKRQDTYQWLKKPGNALLLWGKDNHYFVKSYKK